MEIADTFFIITFSSLEESILDKLEGNSEGNEKK
jgi:hypothetical protein